MEITPVLREVWSDQASGARVGIVAIDVVDASLTLDVLYWNCRNDDWRRGWPIRDAASGDLLQGTGGGGQFSRGVSGTQARIRSTYVTLPGLRAIQATSGDGHVDERIDLVPAPRQADSTRYITGPQPHDITDLAQRFATSTRTDLLPWEVVALDAEPFDTDQGPAIPIALERWHGSDVVTFTFEDDKEPGLVSLHRIRTDGHVDIGIPLSSCSGDGGARLQLAFLSN
jgi:hypothetical protein